MNNNFILEETKVKLNQNYARALAPYLIVYGVFLYACTLLYILASLPKVLTGDTSLFVTVLAVVVLAVLIASMLIVTAPIEFGMLRFYARVYKNAVPDSTDFATAFKKGAFGKSVFLRLIRFGLVLLGTLLLVVPGVVLAVMFSQSTLVQRNNMRLSAIGALKESARIMKGHCLQYFKLRLRFLHWYAVSVLTLGAGFIFLMPYLHLSKMVFFRRVITGDTDNLPQENTADTDTDVVTKTKSKQQTVATKVLETKKVPLSREERIAQKLSNPVVPIYDDFDKSPEQIALEEELRSLIVEEDLPVVEGEGSQTDTEPNIDIEKVETPIEKVEEDIVLAEPIEVLEPVVEVEPVIEIVEPVVEVEQIVEVEPIIEPTVEVVEPVIEMVEPIVEVAEPVVEAVEPIVEIVEPVVEIVEPTEVEVKDEAVEPTEDRSANIKARNQRLEELLARKESLTRNRK